MGDQLPLGDTIGLEPIVTAVGAAFEAALEADPSLLDTEAVVLRASDSLVCFRELGFRLFRTPTDAADDWNPADRQKGQVIDREIKAALVKTYRAQTDVTFDLLPRVPLGGVGDAVYELQLGQLAGAFGAGADVAVEIKSVSTKKLMGLIGNWRNHPAGPDANYICQAALLGLAVAADAVHIICVSRDDPYRRAEWIIGMDDDLVHLPVVRINGELTGQTPRHLATGEARRQANILAVARKGTLPAREVPGYGMVEYVPHFRSDIGDPFTCRYCGHNETCRALPTGEVAGFSQGWAA